LNFSVNRCFIFLAVSPGLLSSACAQQSDATGEKTTRGQQSERTQSPAVDFVREIQPILRDNCYECHAGTTEEGGLNLGIKARALKGGDSEPPIVAGESDKSLLIQLVSSDDDDWVMPPDGKKRLNSEQIDLLREWIDQGAQWPDGTDVVDPKMEQAKRHWSFQRLRQIQVSADRPDDNWSQTPIDRFVHQRLNKAGLHPSPPASGRSLVRRLYFDLIGLPPTPDQTRQFLVAHSEDPRSAVQNLVDQLLDSDRYGERWGRHWLDVARYADSDGQEADQDRPHAYVYRDFVIQAFNDNMPYDQFVRWQIAGDEFKPNNDAAVSATGFLTAGPSFKLPETFLESERLMNRYNELDDVISTVGSGLLGITVACARCHDHKYDAFSAKEYYQLLGVFHSGDRVTSKLPGGSDGYFFQDFDDERRTTWLFRRSDFYDREIEVDIGFPAVLSSGADAKDFWRKARETYNGDNGKPNSTLQRRALADWITDTEKGGGALLARVIVNRIWHHHFDRGLVGTTSDFGVRGDEPTHPQLLEYLAKKFVDGGWKVKSLHREILTSAVWQQAGTGEGSDTSGPQIDPENRLLWRMLPQRLEAEVMRDAMLSVSETLNLEAGGPGFKPYIAPEANLARNIQGERYPEDAEDDATTRRRSVYMFHKRLIPYPMFQAFDRPDLMTSCARRQNTTVAPQAMVILNDRFVRAVARDFAGLLIEKIGRSVPKESELRPTIQLAFETAFARLPTETEMATSIRFIEAQAAVRTERSETDPRLEALTDYCQSLFGLNEFIYID